MTYNNINYSHIDKKLGRVITIKILIADDHKIIRQSLKLIIEKNNDDIEVIATVSNGKEAYEFCCRQLPDIILMDVSMPECNGIEATKLIKKEYPQVKILILTSYEEDAVAYEAILNGADGYISKDVGKDELLLSIRSTAAGLKVIQKDILHTVSGSTKNQSVLSKNQIEINGITVKLTDRQMDIIKMIVNGYDNKQIGSELFIAEGTVKNSITEIISKLQCKDRTQLAVFALKNYLI
jgi:DNA-binding NarL/FixJ family response regulator